jgi:superfamily II DNA or RNA helicase
MPADGEATASAPARASSSQTASRTPVPCLRLYTEPLLVNTGTEFAPEESEQVLPVLNLRFDYGPDGGAPDPAAERHARQLLESFGPLELGCLDAVSARLGSQAHYLVRADLDRHALCSFSGYALPQLRSFGWRVEVAPDYPFQVVEGDQPFYAEVEPEQGTRDWFNLELGIEVDGRRINLLPALLEALERLPPSARLDATPAGARFFALPVGEHRYVAIPPERMAILLKVLRELYQPGADDHLRFPAVAARALADIDAAFAGPGFGDDGAGVRSGGMRWYGDTAIKDRGEALRFGPPQRELPPPPGLRAELRPYQRQGLAWLQHLVEHEAGGVLADDMGLGKTLQAIAHLTAEKQAGRLGPGAPALVVAPTSLMGNWQRELGRFAPYLKVLPLHGPGRHKLWPRLCHADVVLTSYPALVRDQGDGGDQDDSQDRNSARNGARNSARYAGTRFSVVLLDEAQAIKNPRSQAHRAVVSLDAGHRLCLSGTPVENSLSELWSLFEFCNPGLLGDAEWFAHRYVRPIERQDNVAVRAERLNDLRAQVAPFVLRRTKEQVARELPPKTEIVRPVELTGRQRDLYEGLRLAGHAEVRKAIAEKGLGASTLAILDALMKLRQVCCDPRLLPGETAREVRESAKYTLLMDLVAQQRAAGRRLLVFSQFATMLGLIGQGLTQAGVRYALLTGATTNREKAIDEFQSGKVDVFLISLKAGGTGLNLTTADTVVHYDPWWNPAAQAQATDRAHRIGQTRPVFVYNLIVAGSVEERMLALQRRKRALAEGLLGRQGSGDPRDGGTPLSASDVDRLFAPIEDDSDPHPV